MAEDFKGFKRGELAIFVGNNPEKKTILSKKCEIQKRIV